MKKILAFLLVFSITLPCFAAQSGDMSEYLSKAQEEGIIFGDENGVLNEDKEATRAEFLAIATRFWGLSGGENVFSDVTEKDWFCKSIAAANFCGIFAGTPEGEAKPYELIKTEDAIAIIGRYYNATAHKGKYTGIAEYAADYFGYAFENGLFSSWRHLPNSKQGVTKGEIISLFYGYRDKNVQTDCFRDGYPKLSQNQQFNSLSVDVMTETDCEISYAISQKDGKGYSWVTAFDKQEAGTLKTIVITADINRMYDLYIKAVSKENGSSRISEFLNVSPLSFTQGNGSESRPYEIYSEIQLRQISAFSDKSFVLGNNITVTGDWTPIKNFKGVLDGDGYRISGIKINDSSQKTGLFESIKGGTVKNLAVDADISVKDTAGIIAGENNGGHISGCTVTGEVCVSGANGGGICGINSGEITDCLSSVYSVKAGSFAGGISGQNLGDIKNCLSTAETVTSDMYAGGIAGTNNGGFISGCVAANIAVYNTMTYNGGKVSTNRNDGVMKNNYSFSEMVSNAAKTEMSANSRNGLELPWDTFLDEGFYFGIGWDGKKWKEAKNGFKLICPKNAAEPILESGRTPYFPKRISSAEELIGINKNGKGHYVLTRDITLSIPWKTIDFKDGFSGTLDGDGHTIYNLTLKGETGMFSNITGGTVKNLRLKQVKATFNTSGGVISACNYGYIENCIVSGDIATAKANRIGGITAENNGRIENCKVEADITANVDEITVGGICAKNLGVISKSAFSGAITVSAENSVIGGICGADTEGYISESAANAAVYTEKGNAVVGGICAVSEETQVYKCASMGELRQKGADILTGGICGTADAATVYNCFSQTKIKVEAENAKSGGICAEAVDSNIQNTYATGEIQSAGAESVSGGICGVAESSFIVQNVALNPLISAEKVGAIVGEYESSEVTDNYSHQKVRKISKTAQSPDKNGTVKPEKDILNAEFYLKPLSENGLLGWDETAWTEKDGYLLPVLTDTPLMENVKNPEYK
ncbi:MAG: hypothetical protein IK057_03735 [Clostridia bacterium]|nr:hypothetical protein [Clostridia bacterium]